MKFYIKYKKMNSNVLWSITGTIFYALGQMLLMILIARLGSVEVVGTYALGIAISAPLFMLLNMQLRSVLVTDTNTKDQFSRYLEIRLASSIIAIVVIAVISMLGEYDTYTSLAIILIGVIKGIDSIHDIFYGLFQKNERMDLVAKTMIYRTIMSISFFLTFYWIFQSLQLGLFVMAVVGFIFILVNGIPNAKKFTLIKLSFSFNSLLPLIKLAFPLGIAVMIISLNDNIPRYFLKKYSGMEELGYYAAVVYLKSLAVLVISAVGNAVSPMLARLFAQNNIKAFAQRMVIFCVLSMCIGLISFITSIFLGDTILLLIYGREYVQYQNLLELVMVAAIFEYLCSALGFGLGAARLFSLQPIIFSIVTALSLCLSSILIPKLGLMGASYVLITSAVSLFLIMLSANLFAIMKRYTLGREGKIIDRR